MKFDLMGNSQDSLLFCFRQFMVGDRPDCMGTLIFGRGSFLSPSFYGAYAQAKFFAGRFAASSILTGFFYQLGSLRAIRGADQASSPSPQIARAFRRRVRSAAVSARADSLRRSSFSKSRLRFFSLLSSCCN